LSGLSLGGRVVGIPETKPPIMKPSNAAAMVILQLLGIGVHDKITLDTRLVNLITSPHLGCPNLHGARQQKGQDP
jgi:hypothetical protein